MLHQHTTVAVPPRGIANDPRAKVIASLIQKAREVLKSGLRIAVLGWMGPSKFTEKVDFYNQSSPPASIGDTIGLVLYAKNVSHPVTEGIKRPICQFPLALREIKDILKSCEDLLTPPPCITKVNGKSHPAMEATELVISVAQVPPADAVTKMAFDILDFETTPTRRHEMDNMDRFTEAFLEEAKKNKEGLVGKITLGKLFEKHDIKGEPRRLIKAGWLVGVLRDGCNKIGSYKAGEKMLSSVKQEKFEPEDPSERAKFLIAQKPDLLAEKAGLEDELKRVTSESEAKIAQVDQKLTRIETAEKLLEGLKAL